MPTKALIITRQIKDYLDELEQINNSNILKIAVNTAACKSDYRLFSDYDMWTTYNHDKYLKSGERLITAYAGNLVLPNHIYMYYKPVIDPHSHKEHEIIVNHRKMLLKELFYYGGSIIPSTDLAISLGATDILLIADNKVYYEKFQRDIRNSIDKLKAFADIKCFKADNNFNVPYEDLAKFLQGE